MSAAAPATRLLRPHAIGLWSALAPGAPPLARWVMTALLRGADRVPFTPDTFTTSGVARRRIAQCVLGMQREGWVDVEAQTGLPTVPRLVALDELLARMAGEASLVLTDQRGLAMARHRMEFQDANHAAAVTREVQRLLVPPKGVAALITAAYWYDWRIGPARFGSRTLVIGTRIFHLVTDRVDAELDATASVAFAESLARRALGAWPMVVTEAA